LEEFANLRKNGLIAIVLQENDELIGVRLSTGDDELLLGSREGMCIRFSENHVRPMGRVSRGVRAMKLDEDDRIIDMAVIEPDCHILAITERGYGKRTSPDEFREQSRNGKGLRVLKPTEKTGKLAALLLVHPEEDLMLITDDGTIIRSAVDSIRITGRYAVGVKMMRLNENSRIIGVARAEKEADETSEADEQAPVQDQDTAADAPD
jgi:DNA gyrase subunit A